MILHGDCLSVLRTMPEASVHCVVTSPPYWGLRDYGVDGQLGLERTPDEYVANMVEVFREVRRVLRPEGTCWLNIGDCYANDGKFSGETGGKQAYLPDDTRKRNGREKRFTGLKPKDLVGVPWLLAFALRADGWYLRSEIIWAKGLSFCDSYAGSVMPESVTDRPTRGHEQLFLLTKSERYFYDQWAVKERGVYPPGTLAAKGSGTREGNRRGNQKMAQRPDGNHPWDGYAVYDGTRNLRTVWAIGVEPFKEAHFATFPPDLVHPCVAAGTSDHGVCAACGAPYRRVVEQEDLPDDVKRAFAESRERTAEDHGRTDGFTTHRPNYQRKTTGQRWERTCDCDTPQVRPATVLDPFSGAGTVGVVCQRMQRNYVGIELNPDYIAIAERRIGAVAPLFGETA